MIWMKKGEKYDGWSSKCITYKGVDTPEDGEKYINALKLKPTATVQIRPTEHNNPQGITKPFTVVWWNN